MVKMQGTIGRLFNFLQNGFIGHFCFYDDILLYIGKLFVML